MIRLSPVFSSWALTLGLAAAPALAAPDAAGVPTTLSAAPTALATVTPATILTAEEKTAYRAIFAAIRAKDWTSAAAGLEARPDGPLSAVARAELILAKGSPKAEVSAITATLTRAPELPQAPALLKLAASRGATGLPALPAQHDFVRYAGASKRVGASPTRSDAAAARLSATVTPLLKQDQPAAAEALVEGAAGSLTAEALTEWRQRVAWAWYQVGDDAAARRVATLARGGTGEWLAQADWVAGLAAWRSRDCAAAGDAFSAVASHARDAETMAAGLYWAARADTACQRPEKVQARLRSAARLTETFYGMLAAESLGLARPAADTATALRLADTQRIASLPNVRTAEALGEIGETALADQLVRQQARIGAAADHGQLLALAAKLQLPATQVWLAQNGPSGATLTAAARYPAPAWAPVSGWRVDKALLFAHALQESQFRADAVSPAGARGLMQLMPGTARLIAKKRGEAASDPSRLNDPAFAFEYGQYYLQDIADRGGTGGLLPKVIAAYNAGPGRIPVWNANSRAQNDPLLYIESIPYAETRGYVTTVMRNYWMYQQQAGVAAASATALTQGLWPRFPGLPGKTALRIEADGTATGTD
ncbi:transglycosylase SLT domain-containing protein [Sphingomonas naphthae]|uniref:Transglycosylase SLT domain-containing protein n=1 Tax=Sphingomonas naphthae TaxID=1813468 RepID=A0ABY7TNJ4_9SPHN|nr:transglycosylase SLT domain-containing protein [Sphingomonas naphthae]WCT74807.1 transglycosylase SLT domain-containing protein [Sphingomonas naphthae]